MKLTKQTVYLPVKVKDDFTFLITEEIRNYLNSNCSIDFYKDGRCVYTPSFITQTNKESEELEHLIIERLDRKEGYFFTDLEIQDIFTKFARENNISQEKVKIFLNDNFK